MIWITTPFLVALQYFSADQPIFTSFDRSPRNFIISLCILALAFPLVVWGCNSLYCLVNSAIHRLCATKARDEEDLEGTILVLLVQNHASRSQDAENPAAEDVLSITPRN